MSLAEVAREVAAEAFARFRPVGAAVAVVKGADAVSFGLGVRDVRQDAPVGAGTTFPIASCTKSFTAALAACLVDDGAVDWDQPIRELLPSLRFHDSALTAQVTLRDLLAHRTGLARVTLLEYGADFRAEELLERLHCVPSIAPLRSTMTYTNIGYLAAGNALAASQGTDWATLVRQRILQPLGIGGATACFADTVTAPDLAQPHVRVGEQWIRIKRLDRTCHAPASAVHATATDMCRWLQLHVEGGAGLLSASSWRELHAPQVARNLEAPGARTAFPIASRVWHGMGWNLYQDGGHRVSTHSGEVAGYASQMAVVPQLGIGVYVVNNSADEAFSFYLLHRLLDACTGTKRDWVALTPANRAPQPPTAQPVALDETTARHLVGCYRSQCLGDLRVERCGAALRVSFARAPRYDWTMVPLADGSWRVSMDDPGFGADANWNLRINVDAHTEQPLAALGLPDIGRFDRI